MKILQNLDDAVAGKKPSAGAKDVNDMKAILESFDRADEGPMPPAPMSMPPAMPPKDDGDPVSVNVSMNARGKDHVKDLLDLMKAAGLSDSGVVSKDIENDEIDFDLDKDGNIDMKLAKESDLEEGSDVLFKVKDADGDVYQIVKYMGRLQAFDDDPDSEMGGGMGPYDYDEKTSTIEHPKDANLKVTKIGNEEYSNEPDEEYRDTQYMTKDISGGINREKNAYKAVQRGDNAMAVESIKEQLWTALNEKKKPDENENGIPDYAEDGKGPNDLKKKKKKK